MDLIMGSDLQEGKLSSSQWRQEALEAIADGLGIDRDVIMQPWAPSPSMSGQM